MLMKVDFAARYDEAGKGNEEHSMRDPRHARVAVYPGCAVSHNARVSGHADKKRRKSQERD